MSYSNRFIILMFLSIFITEVNLQGQTCITKFTDDFSGTLANWNNPTGQGSWTISGGKLVGYYDITCGSTSCPQADLILNDQYQISDNWKATSTFSRFFSHSYGGNVYGNNATFALWVNSSNKIAVSLGEYGVDLTGFKDSLSVAIQKWNGSWVYTPAPGASKTGRFKYPAGTWNTDGTNTASIQKNGTSYKLFFNDLLITEFDASFLTGTVKIGYHCYGSNATETFQLDSCSYDSKTKSLTAYYPFNGNANDASGYGNNGTILGGVTLSKDRFGKSNNAMYFNGIDGYIQIPNSASLKMPTAALTISGWINIESFPGIKAAAILHKTNTTNYGQYGLNYMAWSTPGIFFASTSANGNAPAVLDFNKWHHLVSTYQAGVIKIYLNGVLISTSTSVSSLTADNNPLAIGLDSPGSTEYLKGKLDDIRLYNRALSQTEISTLYTENNWPLSAPVRDIDGNTYDTVKIGTQIWMKQNLKTTKYNDGTSIPNVTDNASWLNLTTPAYSWYNNDEATNKNVYGALYNWYTVNTGKLCPTGWHVPSDEEWKTLEMNLGMSQAEADATGYRGTHNEGGKLKETGLLHWLTPNTGADNNSGFTGLGGGYRYGLSSGTFYQLMHYGCWWTLDGKIRMLMAEISTISRDNNDGGLQNKYGFSVRCLKDGSSSGLVASYPFNGNANDESGNGNNGTNNGATLTSNRFGNNNSAYDFDGINSYIDIPNNAIQSPNQAITLNSWVKVSQFPTTVNCYTGCYKIINKGRDDGLGNYSLNITNSNGCVGIYNPVVQMTIRFSEDAAPQNSSYLYGVTTLQTGKWYHLVGTYDGSKMKLYVNGNLDSETSVTKTLTQNSGNIWIGRHTDNSSYPYPFNGLIDDIRIFSRALSAAEIDILYKENGWPYSAPVIDIEGNTYDTVKIGTQTWMRQNLKTKLYNDRIPIPNVTDNVAWGNLTTPAYCWYNNDEAANKNIYGALYNWHTVNTGKICPSGWRVPSDSEFKTLELYLGMTQVQADLSFAERGTIEGGKLKGIGTNYWGSPNTGADNSSGFTALPGGYRNESGIFAIPQNNGGFWWQSSESSSSNAWYRALHSTVSTTWRYNFTKQGGFSIRCIKNDLNNGLVASYPFNNNANDESGNGNNGTVNGATLTTDRFGKTNGAFSFGTTGSISIPDNNTLDLTNQLTIAAWVYRNSAQSIIQGSIIDKGPNDGYSLVVSATGEIYYQRPNFGAICFTNPNVVSPNRWIFICITQSGDGTTSKIYVDGKEVTINYSLNTTPVINTSPLVIGDGQNKYSGLIDDIRIYNRALASSEIGALYSEVGWGLPPTITAFTPTSGPIGTSVTITGTNFDPVPSKNIIWFGAVKATVASATETGLIVTVPTGATYQPISVTTTLNGLTGYSAKPFNVTFPSTQIINASSFAPKVDLTSGTMPYDVGIGDLDGDGKLDLAIINSSSNTVSVFRNTSVSGSLTNGSFDSKIDFPTGPAPWGITLGDIDGDGKLDLAVTNLSGNTVSVLRNASSPGSITSGSFATKVDFSTGIEPTGVALGDIDGDGKPDIVVVNNNFASNSISIFRNTTVTGSIDNSSFTSRIDLSVGSRPYRVAIQDLDGDNKPDLAVTNNSGNTVSVFRNTSVTGAITTGSFSSKVDFSTGVGPCGISVGDIDLDGKPDLVIANANDNTISVLRNICNSGSIESSSFSGKVDFATGLLPYSAVISDIDGDGKPDLVIPNHNSNTISVFKNVSTTGSISTGSFANKVDFNTNANPFNVAIGDLDGDTRSDLVVLHYNSSQFSIFRNTIFTTIPPPTITSFTPTSGPIGTSVTITGTNFSSTPANNVVWFGAVKATVNTATSTSLSVNVPTGATYQPITVTVNGLTAYSSKPFNVTFSGSQIIDANTFNLPVTLSAGSKPDFVALGDIDGDGKSDIVFTNALSSTLSVLRNISTSGSINSGSFAAKVDFSTGTNTNPLGIATGDIDGDGMLDLAVANKATNTVSLFRNTSSSGTISFATSVDIVVGNTPYRVVIVDIDSDGKPDLVVLNYNNNSFSVHKNNCSPGSITTGSFGTQVDFGVGGGPMNIVAGDIDGDNKPDLIVSNTTINTISVLRNTAITGIINSASMAPKVDITTDVLPFGIAIADLDGDGKSDIFLVNSQVDKLQIFRNISTPGSFTAGSIESNFEFSTGTYPESIAIVDLDGDGKPDVFTGNTTSNSISVFKNTSSLGILDAGSLATKIDFPTNSPACLVVGDLDGDQKPDLVVANGAANTISVFRNNIQTVSAPTIGTITHPTCSVVTGSVVLNGLPATGTWTLTRSPGNVISTGSGTSATVIGLAAGTYTFTVTNSIAITSGPSGDVVINTQPATPTPPAIGTIIHPTCSVATGSVNLNGLPATGTWTLTRSPGGTTTTGTGTTTTISSLAAGTYTFTVTNASSCISVASADVIINSQPATPSAPVIGNITHPTCAVATGTVVLNGLPASGTWTITQSPGGTITTGTGTSTTVSSLVAGTYRFTVTNTSACTSAQSADVVINNQPITPVAPVIGITTQPTCSAATGSVELTDLPATGTWTLTRSPDVTITTGNGTSTTISNLAAGSYTYTVTNASSCVSIQSAAIVINAQPVTPVAPIIGTITQPTCNLATGSIQLTGLPSTGNWTITRSPGGATSSGSGTTVTYSGIAAGTYTYTVTNASGCISVASAGATINVQPVTPTAPVVGTITQPTCSVSTGNVILSGLPAGTWTLTRSPGGTISGTTTTTTLSDLAAGTYTFAVTNSSSCTSAASSEIIINPQPGTPSAPAIGSVTQPTCALATGSVTLSGIPTTGNWTITRTPGGTTTSVTGPSATISLIPAGSYTFTIHNAGTCMSLPSSAVVIDAQPVTPSAPAIGTITQPTCSAATGTVELTDLPATGTWTLTRLPGGSAITGTGTTVVISSLSAGTYSYTVTNATSCISVASADVIINPQPGTPSAPIVGSITQPTCALATGSVILSGIPTTGNWTITRTPGGTTTNVSGPTATISGIPAGSYSFTIVNAGTCMSLASSNVVINPQPVSPTAPVAGTITHPTCSVATGSVILSGLPAGTWTLTRSPGGTTTGSTTTTTISDLAAGTYTFTVTNASSCTSPASADVIINPQPGTPPAPTVGSIAQPTCALSTGSVILGGIPTTGSWVITRSPGGTTTNVTGPTAIISGIPAGSYSFTIVNAGTCMSLASSNVVINAQPVTPSAPAIGTTTQPTCTLTTGSVLLSGLPATGTWSLTRLPGGTITTGTGTTTTISGLAPGTYSFSLSIGTGCTSSSGNVIINNVPIGIIPVIIKKWNDVLICTNLNNKIDKYQWYKGTTPLTGETQDQFYWAKNQLGAYQVLTTDKDGCKNYSNIIQVGSGSKSLTAFPNPVRENVTIDLNDEPTGKAVISVFSEIGVKVLEFETEKEFENLLHELSVETLDEGIYFIRVTVDKVNVYSTKIVVAK